jgi:hypothetical protein
VTAFENSAKAASPRSVSMSFSHASSVIFCRLKKKINKAD